MLKSFNSEHVEIKREVEYIAYISLVDVQSEQA